MHTCLRVVGYKNGIHDEIEGAPGVALDSFLSVACFGDVDWRVVDGWFSPYLQEKPHGFFFQISLKILCECT